MTKSDLINKLAVKHNMSPNQARKIIDTFFDTMIDALQDEERIEIRGFGSFEIRHYESYDGVNPRTMDKISIPPKRLPFFKAGKELKKRLNKG